MFQYIFYLLPCSLSSGLSVRTTRPDSEAPSSLADFLVIPSSGLSVQGVIVPNLVAINELKLERLRLHVSADSWPLDTNNLSLTNKRLCCFARLLN